MKQFFLRSSWSHGDRIMALITLLFVAWGEAPALYPVSMFYEVDEIHVADAVQGADPEVQLVSRINRTTHLARYTATIRDFATNSNICTANSSPPYEAGTALTLDDPKPLSWWVFSEEGSCDVTALEPGRYVVSTRHCWRPYWWLREACDDTSRSNTFTIFATEQELLGHDQQMIQQVPTRSLARTVQQLEQTVVGRTPEGFHRADAQELMDAFCAANPGLSCPSPYALPNYIRQVNE